MKIMQILIICLLLITGLTAVKADTILGLYAGYHYWQHDLADDIESNSSNQNRSETGNIFYFALEHPVPFLPNVKLQQNEVKGQVTGTFQIIGIDGTIQNIKTRSVTDLSHSDITLYYEVLDNWVNLDIGLSAKYFDGNAVFYDQDISRGRKDIDEWIPLLYAKGQFDLPFTGLSAYGSLQTLSLGSDDVIDFEAGLNYETKMGLGATLGYRVLDVDINKNNGFRYNNSLDGFFLGVNFHF